METHQGNFFVFEGIDGSGKSTQVKLLIKRLQEAGYQVETIDFPQYRKKSAGPVEEYLSGKYGSSVEVGPRRASIFFAIDRYDASFTIQRWLAEGKIVICDRYFASNAGHQGGKIQDQKEWEEFIDWLYNLEFGIFKIPRPDINFVLGITPELSRRLSGEVKDGEKLAKKQSFLGEEKQDMHEQDLEHLKQAAASYDRLVKKFPDDFVMINCIRDEQLLSPQKIHELIWAVAEKMI